MQLPRYVFPAAFAVAIAACSALDRNLPTAPGMPSAPSQPTAPSVPSASLPSAPTQPEATTAPSTTIAPPAISATVPSTSAASAAPAAPKTLKSAMKGIEEDWKLLEQQLAAPATMDLAKMAVAADRVAAVMKLAYDPWEDKEVPDFAKFARESEGAFLDLAAKARGGDAEAIKALAKTLQPQHCARCHDAYEHVHG